MDETEEELEAKLKGFKQAIPPKIGEKKDPFDDTIDLAIKAARLRVIEGVGDRRNPEPPPTPPPPPGPKQDEKTTLDIAGIVKSQNDLILGMQSKIIELITN